ncbi:hypothetical protein PgNI_05856 [Pyricularia grisea]|uniref:Uncharacterized protein n=1 Tax=Pyricularia grisea TaxID=148305 RepID=A0A6P8B647_PYRGI|nr:hypothetical protein PgNI_05856 [Pyricularia grisea]TLD10787.1 hypothetical protein PgNI_05856 [Pyricularia grisea]
MGIVKQQQRDRLWVLGLGLVIFFFSPQLLVPAEEPSTAAGLLEGFCVTSSSPRRSASVSMLVRSSRIGVTETRRSGRRRGGYPAGAEVGSRARTIHPSLRPTNGGTPGRLTLCRGRS